jgi:hypothetical protein
VAGVRLLYSLSSAGEPATDQTLTAVTCRITQAVSVRSPQSRRAVHTDDDSAVMSNDSTISLFNLPSTDEVNAS